MSKYFNKIAAGFDMLDLQVALRRMPGLFGKYKDRCDPKGPHHESEDIWIRYNDRKNVDACGDQILNSDHPANGPHRPVWYPAYYQLPQLRHIIFSLMNMVEGEELGTVLLVKLEPGKQVYPHTDGGWTGGYYEKYFIPVQAAPGSVFNFPDGTIYPVPGEVYWFNNSVPHNYENHSCEDTIMLIVTIRSDVVPGAK